VIAVVFVDELLQTDTHMEVAYKNVNPHLKPIKRLGLGSGGHLLNEGYLFTKKNDAPANDSGGAFFKDEIQSSLRFLKDGTLERLLV
jgi:hypothetical protein